jgi:hypothetical protein
MLVFAFIMTGITFVLAGVAVGFLLANHRWADLMRDLGGLEDGQIVRLVRQWQQTK